MVAQEDTLDVDDLGWALSNAPQGPPVGVVDLVVIEASRGFFLHSGFVDDSFAWEESVPVLNLSLGVGYSPVPSSSSPYPGFLPLSQLPLKQVPPWLLGLIRYPLFGYDHEV